MSDNFLLAEQTLLAPAAIDERAIMQTFHALQGHAIDSADLYFQASRYESWGLEDGIVKSGSYNTERGVGVRAISGEKTGFAYSDQIELSALQEAAQAARSIARAGQQARVATSNRVTAAPLYTADDPLTSLATQDKVDLLKAIDQQARCADPRIKQVNASLLAVQEVILIVNAHGLMAADVRPLVRLNVSVIAEQHGRREEGYAGMGGRYGYDQLLANDGSSALVQKAVNDALINLDAVAAPAGTMPVVLGPGWPGVLLHEAIGHGLEGDFCRKGTSAFSGRIGQRVACPGCTIVDDGTLAGRRGSLSIDDEGEATQCTVLIEDGILRNYMQDQLNARLMGMAPTGNGRRESYAHVPMPRMTNTYMLAGQEDPQDIIRSVKKGLYAVNFGGGQVDITSGKFVFCASLAYLIEDGKITRPVKGATLIGDGPTVLTKVSKIGHDLSLDDGVGTCGKEGQSVPVGVGQPTLKIDELTVGGTES